MRLLGTKRVVIALLLGLLLAGVVAAALYAAGGLADDRSPVAVLAWVAPVLAGFIVGGVAFLLLESESDSSTQTESLQACDSCGAELLADWRMCPNCGAIVDEDSRAKRREYRARAIL